MELAKRAAVAAAAIALAATSAAAQSPPVQPAPDAATYRVASVPASTRIAVAGTLVLDITLTLNADLNDNSVVTVSYAELDVSDDSYTDEAGVFNIPATVSNHQAIASVSIPYTWLVASTGDQVTITVGVTATATTKSGNEIGWGTTLGATIALPNNGATTTVPLAGSM
jgi:hypothetical protein